MPSAATRPVNIAVMFVGPKEVMGRGGPAASLRGMFLSQCTMRGVLRRYFLLSFVVWSVDGFQHVFDVFIYTLNNLGMLFPVDHLLCIYCLQ